MVVCGETPAKRPQGELSDYISIMRLDHAIKHIFIIPGILLALMLRGDHGSFRVNTFLLTLLSCLLSASANYVINEWFDAPFDAHHPSKFRRPCVAHRLNGSLVAAEYLGLAILSLVLGYFVAPLVCYAAAALLISGILYNVQPLRLKDHAFVDVLSEAIYNPIRLVFGWAMIDPSTLPPGSVLLTYWFGGAFLMNTKRLAEFRDVVANAGRSTLDQYRPSFKSYTEIRLLLASLLYGELSLAGFAVFMVKYRIEYVLALPVLAGLFCLYLWIGLQPHSTAQAPERLFREGGLLAGVAFVGLLLVVLTFVDIPALNAFMAPHYIRVP